MPERWLSLLFAIRSIRHLAMFAPAKCSGQALAALPDVAEQGRLPSLQDRLFSLSLDLICIAGFDGYFKRVNPAFERTLGYAPAELTGKPSLDIVHSDDVALTQSAVQKLASGEAVVSFLHRVRHKDGSYRWLSWDAVPVPEEGLIYAIGRDRTEEHELRTALRVSDDWLEGFLAHVPMALSVNDMDGRYRVVNAAFERMSRLGADHLVGKTYTEIWPADLADQLQEMDKRATATGVPVRDELTIASEGGKRTVGLTKFPMFDGDGHASSVGGIAIDITRRRRAEELLRDSEALLLALFRESPVAMFLVDMGPPANGLNRAVDEDVVETEMATPRFVTDANKACERLSGYPREELVGRRITELVSGGSPAERRSFVAELVQHGSVRGLDHKLAIKGGRILDVLASAELVEVSGQRLLVVQVVDITERIRAEMALREAQERLQGIMDHSPAVIVMKDREGRYVLANSRFAEMLERPISEIIGNTVNDIFPAEVAESLRSGDRRVLASGASLQREEVLPLPKGDRTFLSNRFPVADSGGAVRWVCNIATDITERKEIERALQLAKDEADMANSAKSEFLSRMSHELRTPLNVILGFGQVLELDQLEPAQAEAVGHILNSGRQLLELIDEVLDIERIDSGRLSFSIEPISVADLVNEVLAQIEPVGDERRVALNLVPFKHDLSVFADRQRLRQILLNLLSNAIKYNREGGTVTTMCGQTSEGRIRISVSDTGPGISAAGLRRLFTPFDRLGAEATNVQGTGLGLTISKHLVETMGGEIGVDTSEGAGSTFWVDLPSAQDAMNALGDASPSAPESGIRIVGANRTTVLCVEDNPANVGLMERLFSQYKSLQLLVATRGSLGLELAREHRPDLILLDLHLPDMAGAEVLAALRSHPETSSLPVIVVSADASPVQQKLLMEGGALAYLTKPIDVRQFIALVGSILQEESTAHAGVGDAKDRTRVERIEKRAGGP